MELKNKKKILVFIDWYLPGFRAGGPIRSCANLVEHLKDEFEISVITSDTDYMEEKPYPNVKSDEWTTLADGTRVYYFSKEKIGRAEMKKLIAAEQFDKIYLNGIFSKNFTLLPLDLLRKEHSDKIIIAARGMLAPSALDIKRTKKSIFLASAKMFGLFKGVTFQATNEEEVKDIQNVFGKNVKVLLAPNLPQRMVQAPLKERRKEQGSLSLVNIARVAPEKNLLFALQALAGTRSKITFDFYGPVYDEVYWNECKAAISKLPPNVKANYKGVVEPGRVIEVLAAHHFLFMPTRGENFGHIILQSLTAGTPVIISDQTPWKEMGTKKAGCDLPLDDVNNFILALEVSALLTQQEYDVFSASAYALASSVINDRTIIEQNKRLFD